jgi:hypothetical protein
MGLQRVERPFAVILIASFQFAKAAFLLTVAALLWLAPDALPNSQTFTDLLFIAAHGKDLPGFLVPVFGLYVAYIGISLLRLRPAARRNLAVSSAITIAVSLQRLGFFGESSMTSHFDRQALYILILLDFAVYVYLAFHPEIARSFKSNRD